MSQRYTLKKVHLGGIHFDKTHFVKLPVGKINLEEKKFSHNIFDVDLSTM